MEQNNCLMADTTTISLVISTYNNPDYLELVLLSVLKQKALPDEVIIADDGSKKETEELINTYKKRFPVPLIHVWQEDFGFRKCKILNDAVRVVTSNYMIFIDGDLLLHPFFIYDYKNNLQKNTILVASRAFISEKYSKYLVEKKQTNINFNKKNIEQNLISAIRIPWLHHIIKGNTTYAGARGGLMGIFKSDYIKVNGFNEDFSGWGREDSELFVRIINAGIKRKNIKFAAITYHLWHPFISRASLPANDALLAQAISEKSVWCKNGVDKYFK